MPSRPRADRTSTRASRAGAAAPLALRPEELAGRAAVGLSDFLPGQRWFGAKTRIIRSVSALDEAAVPGSDGILALFRITYTEGASETYCVPVRPAAAVPGFADATEDPGFGGGLAEQIRLEATLPGRCGRFRFGRTGLLEEILPPRPARVARFRGEQSNTSVVFDQAAILKLYRRLEAGPNPEFEIGDLLARHPAFRGAPRLLGAIAYETPGQGEAATVAVLQEFVRNRGDAWTAILARLAEYYAAAGGLTEAGTPDAASARAAAAADAKEAASLGELTGRLHVALASAPPGTPLAPEPIEAADLAGWQAEMETRLARSIQALEAGMDALPASVRAVARQTLAEAPRLRGGLAALRALATEGVSKIRVHGDYHLGQVLATETGFVILDFEGEPARSLAERRAKQCALKDVAGMLRSYAYAANVGLRRAMETAPASEDLAGRLAPWAAAWEDGVRAAFLDAYLAETLDRRAAFLPPRREPIEAALRVYELDKAIYELEYELNHRPTWLSVPLDGWRRAVAA